MRREECVDLFTRIPPSSHAQVNLVLRNQSVLSVDVVARFEPIYVVFRGREGGTTDEGRAFFVPYEEIAYIRLERVVRLSELRQMFGEACADDEDRLFSHEEKVAAELAKQALDPKTPNPVPVSTILDPAGIARQNLLDRIRAARANVAGTTGKLNDRK